MKKVLPWVFVAAVFAEITALMAMGISLLDGDYDIALWAYIAQAGIWIMIGCLLYRAYAKRCPNCGTWHLVNGAYCPRCGTKISGV